MERVILLGARWETRKKPEHFGPSIPTSSKAGPLSSFARQKHQRRRPTAAPDLGRPTKPLRCGAPFGAARSGVIYGPSFGRQKNRSEGLLAAESGPKTGYPPFPGSARAHRVCLCDRGRGRKKGKNLPRLLSSGQAGPSEKGRLQIGPLDARARNRSPPPFRRSHTKGDPRPTPAYLSRADGGVIDYRGDFHRRRGDPDRGRGKRAFHRGRTARGDGLLTVSLRPGDVVRLIGTAFHPLSRGGEAAGFVCVCPLSSACFPAASTSRPTFPPHPAGFSPRTRTDFLDHGTASCSSSSSCANYKGELDAAEPLAWAG